MSSGAPLFILERVSREMNAVIRISLSREISVRIPGSINRFKFDKAPKGGEEDRDGGEYPLDDERSRSLADILPSIDVLPATGLTTARWTAGGRIAAPGVNMG